MVGLRELEHAVSSVRALCSFSDFAESLSSKYALMSSSVDPFYRFASFQNYVWDLTNPTRKQLSDIDPVCQRTATSGRKHSMDAYKIRLKEYQDKEPHRITFLSILPVRVLIQRQRGAITAELNRISPDLTESWGQIQVSIIYFTERSVPPHPGIQAT